MLTCFEYPSIIERDLFEYDFSDFSNLNVLVAPWCSLYTHNKLDLISDFGVFDATFCKSSLHNKPELANAIAKLGIKFVFTPNAEKGQNYPFLTIPYIDYAKPIENKAKSYTYCFVGWDCHPVRSAIFSVLSGSSVIKRERFHYNSRNKEKEEQEYMDILAQSTFSLCPRGKAPSSMRFWESLRAGSIPILISDNVILPEYDWNSCIFRLSEKQVLDNPSIINQAWWQINKQQRREMSKNCIKAYNHFFSLPSLYSYINTKLSEHCR